MPLKAGSAFFLASTGGFSNPGGSHLFVCLTDPDDKGDVISVSLMTHRKGLDGACVLAAGEHEFLHRDSCANYMMANKIYAPGTEKSPLYSAAKDVTTDVLGKLRTGLLVSDNTPDFVVKYAKARGIKS
jgi:hypothetical protein